MRSWLSSSANWSRWGIFRWLCAWGCCLLYRHLHKLLHELCPWQILRIYSTGRHSGWLSWIQIALRLLRIKTSSSIWLPNVITWKWRSRWGSKRLSCRSAKWLPWLETERLSSRCTNRLSCLSAKRFSLDVRRLSCRCCRQRLPCRRHRLPCGGLSLPCGGLSLPCRGLSLPCWGLRLSFWLSYWLSCPCRKHAISKFLLTTLTTLSCLILLASGRRCKRFITGVWTSF